jgi:excisionase family DNA binding protein
MREVTTSLLTAEDVPQLLGVPKSGVYEQSREGRIPTVRLGRYRRYRREAIEAWVAQPESPARGARQYAGPQHLSSGPIAAPQARQSGPCRSPHRLPE